jgi:Calcineurin-like phosphoesterase
MRLRACPVLFLLATSCGTVVLPTGNAEPADPAPSGEIETTVFLIGDAGNPAPDEPVLKALKQQVTESPGERVIVFLGDNLYPRGMPVSGAPDRSEAERRLRGQMEVGIETRTPTYFVAGNHDWTYMGPTGLEGIKRQSEFIEQNGGEFVRMLPKNGCPGPEVVDVGRRVRLILLDSQWWVHEFAKPRDSTSGCPTFTEEQVLDSLRGALEGAARRDSAKQALPEAKDSVAQAADSAKDVAPAEAVRDSVDAARKTATDSLEQVKDTMVNRHVIVAAHHPIESGGQHGGYFGWQRHLFPLRRLASWLWIPLPGIGSIEPIARREGGTNQDLAGPLYAHMRSEFEKIFAEVEPLVYAAGHDHDMQVLRGTNVNTVLVTGTGIYGHVSPVDYRPNTRFAAAASGYMRLDILRDGKVRLGVVTVNALGETEEAFSMYLE